MATALVLIVLFRALWLLGILLGTAYVVFWLGYSGWWWVLAVVLMSFAAGGEAATSTTEERKR